MKYKGEEGSGYGDCLVLC